MPTPAPMARCSRRCLQAPVRRRPAWSAWRLRRRVQRGRRARGRCAAGQRTGRRCSADCALMQPGVGLHARVRQACTTRCRCWLDARTCCRRLSCRAAQRRGARRSPRAPRSTVDAVGPATVAPCRRRQACRRRGGALDRASSAARACARCVTAVGHRSSAAGRCRRKRSPRPAERLALAVTARPRGRCRAVLGMAAELVAPAERATRRGRAGGLRRDATGPSVRRAASAATRMLQADVAAMRRSRTPLRAVRRAPLHEPLSRCCAAPPRRR